ncbi:MAG: cyclic nucleotide-binding domain-containing protein [Anaerolineae bacterium]
MDYSPILKQTDLLMDLDTERLKKISAICQEKMYNGYDVIFEENTPGDELYIILSGQVEILVDPHTLGVTGDDVGEPSTIATLRRGQSFGEVALVDQGVRSASARCAQDGTKLLVINRDKFEQLCREDFELGYLVMRAIAADLSLKIRQTDLMVREQLLWGRRR